MSIVISTDVSCEICGNWIHGTTGSKIEIREARRVAKADGWTRSPSPFTGERCDMCKDCAKKYSREVEENA